MFRSKKLPILYLHLAQCFHHLLHNSVQTFKQCQVTIVRKTKFTETAIFEPLGHLGLGGNCPYPTKSRFTSWWDSKNQVSFENNGVVSNQLTLKGPQT